MYPFGMKVRVKGIIRPAYITWVDEIDVKVPVQRAVGTSPPGVTKITWSQIQKKKLPTQEMRQVDPRGYKRKVEGEPLPNSLPVPKDGGKHRRLLRHKAYHLGVIVGWTWRSEGKFHPDDINYLSENRRVWGHEVALNNYQGTNHAWVTRLAFCLVDDLDPFGL